MIERFELHEYIHFSFTLSHSYKRINTHFNKKNPVSLQLFFSFVGSFSYWKPLNAASTSSSVYPTSGSWLLRFCISYAATSPGFSCSFSTSFFPLPPSSFSSYTVGIDLMAGKRQQKNRRLEECFRLYEMETSTDNKLVIENTSRLLTNCTNFSTDTPYEEATARQNKTILTRPDNKSTVFPFLSWLKKSYRLR